MRSKFIVVLLLIFSSFLFAADSIEDVGVVKQKTDDQIVNIKKMNKSASVHFEKGNAEVLFFDDFNDGLGAWVGNLELDFETDADITNWSHWDEPNLYTTEEWDATGGVGGGGALKLGDGGYGFIAKRPIVVTPGNDYMLTVDIKTEGWANPGTYDLYLYVQGIADLDSVLCNSDGLFTTFTLSGTATSDSGYIRLAGMNTLGQNYVWVDNVSLMEKVPDWTIVDGFDDGLTWTDTNPGNRSNANWDSTFVIVDSDDAGSGVEMDEELISPFFDCTGYPVVTLTFSHYFNNYSASVADVDVRVGQNGAWTNAAQYLDDDQGQVTLDISTVAAETDSVQIRFHYYNAVYEWYWGVDNVTVEGSTSETIPPVITMTQMGWNHSEGFGAVEIAAEITDGSGLASQDVYYSFNDMNGTYTAVSMIATANPDEYAAELPAGVAGDSVFYYVEAVDASSNSNVGTSPAAGQVYVYAIFPNSGGPDTTGYYWFDSHSADAMAPTFNWIDTSGAVPTGIANGDDWRGTVNLPFVFNFFGTEYDQITVTTNGWIGMGPYTNYNSSYWTNTAIPDASDPNYIVAPLWDDWKAGGSYNGNIYTKLSGDYPNRQFSIIFKDVVRSSTNTDYFTFEAIIHEGSNDIVYQYYDVTGGPGTLADYGVAGTVGIEDPDGLAGTQYTFNNNGPLVFDSMAVKLYSPYATPMVDWCNLQWPYSIDISEGDFTGDIYGQVWEAGVTELPGQAPGLIAELGIGDRGTDPVSDASWTWHAATFNTDVGNNDEFMASVQMNESGQYSYCYRYSLDGGPWTYGDIDGATNGLQLDQLGSLNVSPPAGTQKLLISEIVVTPTNGEYIEIYNPGFAAVPLDDYYITDATYAGGSIYYYQIVEGGGGGGGFADFHARFPAGATIEPGEFQTIALAGDSLFFVEYGVLPTYELFDDGYAVPSDVPDMLEAFSGSVNNQGGLTNGDEVVVLYYWDGTSDLVKDVDYLIYNSGSPAANNEAVDKTGVMIDGPDAGTDSSTYLDDTPIANQQSALNHDGGFSLHRVDYNEGAQIASGGNGITGADETSEDLNNTFSNYSVPSPNADRMTPVYTVSGTVELEDLSAPNLDGTLVTLTGPMKAVWTDTTDTSGYYEFAGVDSGTYMIAFDRENYEPVEYEISVQADVTVNVTLVLVVTDITQTGNLPKTFALEQNFPNPFNPTTRIKYQLPKNTDVKIQIYNSVGQMVKTLVNTSVEAGYHEVIWNGTNEFGSRVSSGIYIYRMVAGDFVSSHKLILMK